MFCILSITAETFVVFQQRQSRKHGKHIEKNVFLIVYINKVSTGFILIFAWNKLMLQEADYDSSREL